MPIPRYQITCTEKQLLAHNTYALRFTKPDGWTFKPGQFLLVDVPLLDTPTDMQTRAYSIASTPTEREILLGVKLKAGGRASTWVEQMVEVGTTATIQGPFGNFTLPAASTKPYLFLATGAGIAPFRSQILELLERDESYPIDLLFGVRDETELFWNNEFEDLARAHERFSFHLTLTRAPDSWNGHRGRVQTLVPGIAPDVASRTIYACGNPDMTKELKSIALEQWGVAKPDLHIEGFI